jgi:hypothetical protein
MTDFFDRFELQIMAAVGSIGLVIVVLDMIVWRP